ncbi:MAG: hypothetical protein JWL96_3500 [Sphingomonas bacterium]|uniref:hypothetical protein n=1 Tax=Sphingomonas bacterium TaxID=1895847 RepID=UPI00260B7391|nr:hypothetical protein [Sphingomonas bacterium]MDB5711430.1 hypothetical protein [Sphingomonas bacterium]
MTVLTSGMTIAALLVAAPLAAQTATPAPTMPGAPPRPAHVCTAAAYRTFDFWVGKWDVYGPAGRLVAHSLIESVYDGCGIRENWMPLGGAGGGSLSVYVPAKKQWEQFWIDSGNTRALFTGGWNGSAMVIQGVWPTAPTNATGPLTRMTYSRSADGSVRQFGENSTDGGTTWTPSFDFTYRKAAG